MRGLTLARFSSQCWKEGLTSASASGFWIRPAWEAQSACNSLPPIAWLAWLCGHPVQQPASDGAQAHLWQQLAAGCKAPHRQEHQQQEHHQQLNQQASYTALAEQLNRRHSTQQGLHPSSHGISLTRALDATNWHDSRQNKWAITPSLIARRSYANSSSSSSSSPSSPSQHELALSSLKQPMPATRTSREQVPNLADTTWHYHSSHMVARESPHFGPALCQESPTQFASNQASLFLLPTPAAITIPSRQLPARNAISHQLLLPPQTKQAVWSATCQPLGLSWGHRHLASSSTGDGAMQPASPSLLAMLPPSWLPYTQLMRLDKPIGTWLLLLPSLWSIALAAPAGQLPDVWTMSLFSLGAVLLRGAGCTINDLWDRDLDPQVQRTRTRPLASGAVQPWQAVALLAGQLSLGLCILLQLNTYSQLLGASSLLLVGTYPLMKRITFWPQAFLGLTINWGALLGWAAVRGSCEWAVVLPLYASGVCWSLVYDTIYAHQDKRDDVAAGVRSTALLFGARTKPVLAGFAALQVSSLVAAGAAADVGPLYYAGVAGMGAHLAWQLLSVDLDNGPQCAATFVSNKWAGAILFLGCVAGRTVP